MQTPEPLNADWAAVSATLAAAGDIRPEQLASAMTLVAKTCAKAIRDDPFEPLTKAEQKILEDEQEGDPLFYDLMFRSDALTETTYVLEWFDKTIALTDAFTADEAPDPKHLAAGSIMCWDHIVPEYHNHQLAHMAALVGSHLMKPHSEFHNRTWLFRLSVSETWELFLGLAQQLDILNSSQVKDLASAVASQLAVE